MDFITAKSEADGFAEMRKQQNAQMAKIIINTMVSDVNKNRKNLGAVDKRMQQLLGMFPMEDRLDIMLQVFYKMC